jgi:FkbM family methyltransferase
MNQILLSMLGKIARLARSTGLGSLLDVSLDLMDFIFMRVAIPPLKVKINGFEVRGYLRHKSFLEHISTGKYESFCRELYEKALRPGMIVVDGGAHIGLYSLLAAQRIGANGKVFAFEPDPYNFQCLVFNITKNRCSNVIPIQKALHNTVGIASLYRSSSTISSSLFNRKGVRKLTITSVPVTTLDKALQGLAINSILIKLDIEGSEPLALQGMSNILQRCNSVVIFAEINPSALRDADLNPEDMISQLESFGFRTYFVDELNKRLTRPTIDRKGMLYCVKKD